MVGKAILLEAMQDSRINQILLINRSPINLSHPKIKELIVQDYEELPTHSPKFSDYEDSLESPRVSENEARLIS